MTRKPDPDVLIALLAVVVLLPALTQPFVFDDFDSVWRTGACLKDPSHFFEPFMGGLLRWVPKVFSLSLFALFGPRAIVYRGFDFALHGLSTWLVARVFATWTGSRAGGRWTAILFAVGFAAYARAPLQASSMTLLCAVALFLLGLFAWQRGHGRWAIAAFAGAALSHEITWGGVFLAPILFTLRPGEERDTRLLARALAAGFALVAVAALVPSPAQPVAAAVRDYATFPFVPFNPGTADAAAPGLAGAANAVLALRPWLGEAVLLVCAAAAWRARGVRLLALAWALVFLLPVAALRANEARFWPANWIERRYVYPSAIAVCALLALGLVRLRPQPRAALAVVVVAWSLAWCAAVEWKLHRDAESPRNRTAYAEYSALLERMDPRWKLR